jgi:hypothetical protein
MDKSMRSPTDYTVCHLSNEWDKLCIAIGWTLRTRWTGGAVMLHHQMQFNVQLVYTSMHASQPVTHSSQSRICAPQHNISSDRWPRIICLLQQPVVWYRVLRISCVLVSYILLLLSDTVTAVRNERYSSRLVRALPKGREQTSLNI